jgi:hypothetical protein
MKKSSTKKNLKRNREWKPFEDIVDIPTTNKRKHIVFEDQPSPIREINFNENFQNKISSKSNPFQSSSMEEEDHILPKVRNSKIIEKSRKSSTLLPFCFLKEFTSFINKKPLI